MPLPAPLSSFGIANITMIDPSDGTLAMAKVLDGGELDIAPEVIKLYGGASSLPWAYGAGDSAAEIKVTLSDYSPNIMRFVSQTTPTSFTENSTGSATASVTGITNLVGTSVSNAVGGISNITIQSGQDNNVGFGRYVIKAVSSSTFNLYATTDASGKISYIDGSLLINSAPLLRGAAASTVSSNGISFTAGSGTAAFTVGDSAMFEIIPPTSYNAVFGWGRAGATNKIFQLIMVSEPSNGVWAQIWIPEATAFANPIPSLMRKEFSSTEFTFNIINSGKYTDPVQVTYERSR